MNLINRLGLTGAAITLGVVLVLVLALAAVVPTNTPVHASSAPDLEVGTPSVDGTTYTGQSFTMSVTVTNAGDAESAATTLRYYRSDSATELGTDSIGALAAEGTSEQSIDLTVPSTVGYYQYYACVDAVTDESDTTNNCSGFFTIHATVQLPPDLSMTSPNRLLAVRPIPFGPGVNFNLQSTVDNVGQTESAATTVHYYQSTDSTVTTSDTKLGTSAVGAIAPGSLSAQAISVTAPSTAGTYYYGACVDTVTGESVTDNNCTGVKEVEVPAPAPNLTVNRMSVSARSVATGGSFTLSARVFNEGALATVATTLRYYVTDYAWNKDPSSDTELGTDAVGALDPAAESDQSIDLTAPSTPGNYHYYACVDAVTDESDTTNNCYWSTVRVTVNAPAEGAPTISGTPQVGQTLTASTSGISDADGLTNVSYSYQWLADDTEIDGATSSTYTVQSTDNGKVIKVRVSFTDDAGNDESLTSTGTAAVNSATGAPTISGTAQVGETLTASTSGISDPDGLTNVTYSYQWLADDTEIDAATSSTYTVQSTDNGKVIKVQVSFTDDGGNDESVTSAATAAVVLGGL